MFDIKTMEQAEQLLHKMATELDPDVVDPLFATRLFEGFARMERLCAGAKTLIGRKVADSGSWRTQGERSAAHWVAKRTGVSVGQAVGMLETSRRLAELPGTQQAVRQGKLSESQTVQIASAAAAHPVSEKELLQAADHEGMGLLKQRCARVIATSGPGELARHEAIRKSRYLRHYQGPDGAFRLDGRFTPEAGARVLAALEPYKNQAFRMARAAGRREPYDAYAADALVNLCRDACGHSSNQQGASMTALAGAGLQTAEATSEGKASPAGIAPLDHAGTSDEADHAGTSGGSLNSAPRSFPVGPPAMINVRVDHSALIRGYAQPGETCEIAGLGPIPVSTVKAMENDAYLSIILTDGDDIKAVCRSSRHIPARLRTALLERDPVCVVPSCDAKDHLEIDHIVAFADNGPTQLDNLARLCAWHHYLKTHRGYSLSGGPGSWSWKPPDSPRPPPHRPRGKRKPKIQSKVLLS